MSDQPRRQFITRGDKLWAYDICERVLWHLQWNDRPLHAVTGIGLDKEEIERARGIIRQLSYTLERQRGTLKRNRPERKL